MNKRTLLADGAIVATVIIVGVTYYFMQEKKQTTSVPSLITNPQSVYMNNSQYQGLAIEILSEGNGVGAQSGQTVIVDYTGMLVDGTVFDSSIPRGEPFPVRLGAGEVIQGWDLGLLGMKVGEKRKLTIAPELGYGKSGFPDVIPPDATLIFEVTLRAIQ